MADILNFFGFFYKPGGITANVVKVLTERQSKPPFEKYICVGLPTETTYMRNYWRFLVSALSNSVLRRIKEKTLQKGSRSWWSPIEEVTYY